MYSYLAEILDALLVHGVSPKSTTRPELVHEFVSDLYRFEIRALRGRLLRGEFPKSEYYDRVVELRNRYRVISVRALDGLEEDRQD